MINKKEVLVIIMIVNIAIMGLFASNNGADITDYPDNYEFLSFTNYGGGESVSGRPNSVRLPIEAYYTPNLPYTFSLVDEENDVILEDGILHTKIYNLGEDRESSQFVLSVLGNESSDNNFDINIDYEPFFHSKDTPGKTSNIAINYVVGYKLGNESSFFPEFIFNSHSLINDVIISGRRYTRVPYSLYLNNGPQNLELLKFYFSWPAITDITLPNGFYSGELLESQVIISIIS